MECFKEKRSCDISEENFNYENQPLSQVVGKLFDEEKLAL